MAFLSSWVFAKFFTSGTSMESAQSVNFPLFLRVFTKISPSLSLTITTFFPHLFLHSAGTTILPLESTDLKTLSSTLGTSRRGLTYKLICLLTNKIAVMHFRIRNELRLRNTMKRFGEA